MRQIPAISLLVFSLASLVCWSQSDCQDGTCDEYGPVDYVGFESPHPYPPGSRIGETVWSATIERPDAFEIALRMDGFNIANGDILLLRGGGGEILKRFTSESPPGALVQVQTSSVTIEIVSNGKETGYGLAIPYVAYRVTEPQAETIPPGTAFRDVTCLKSGFACAFPAWYESARATARIFIQRGSTMAQCTGTMLDRQGRTDILITARHCLVGYVEVLAEFGAEYSPDCQDTSLDCLSPQHENCEGTFYVSRAIYFDPECDWALVAMDGDPGIEWGTVPLAGADPAVGTGVYLVQHPAGRCKEWDAGDVTELGGCSVHYEMMFSAGGSSGSSVRLQSTSEIIGIHVSSNSATRLGIILPKIDKAVLDTAYSGYPPPGTNVAPGCTRVETSSNYGPEWSGWNAIDGIVSLESKWASADLDPPQWLKLDLGKECEITGFGVVSPSSAGEPAVFNPKAYSIQTAPSFDGPWTDEFVVGIHLHTEHVTYRGFPGTTKRKRYVRLYITEANRDDRIARIPEFQVYALDSDSSPPSIHLR